MKCSLLICRMKFFCMYIDILILIFFVIMYCGLKKKKENIKGILYGFNILYKY